MSWPNTPCQAAINSTAAFIVPLQSVWTVAEPDGYDGTGQSHLQDHGVHLISSMFLRRFLYQAWQRRRFDSNSRHHGSQKSNIAIRADPRLLEALRKTVSTGGGDPRPSSSYEWNTFVRLESRSRNSVSSAARYAFNSLF